MIGQGGEFMLTALTGAFPGRRAKTISNTIAAFAGSAAGVRRQTNILYTGSGVFAPQTFAIEITSVQAGGITALVNSFRWSLQTLDGREIIPEVIGNNFTTLLQNYNSLEGGLVFLPQDGFTFKGFSQSTTPHNIRFSCWGTEFF